MRETKRAYLMRYPGCYSENLLIDLQLPNNTMNLLDIVKRVKRGVYQEDRPCLTQANEVVLPVSTPGLLNLIH